MFLLGSNMISDRRPIAPVPTCTSRIMSGTLCPSMPQCNRRYSFLTIRRSQRNSMTAPDTLKPHAARFTLHEAPVVERLDRDQLVRADVNRIFHSPKAK